MSFLEAISARLSIVDTLKYFGFDTGQRNTIPCPIHRGEGNNFSISKDGDMFTCFSHACGGKYKRDSINLYCLLKYGRALPELDNVQKRDVIVELARIVGIDPDDCKREYKKPTLTGMIPDAAERKKISSILADTRTLNQYGDASQYKSNIATKIILFLEVAKSERKLPGIVDKNWEHYSEFVDNTGVGSLINGRVAKRATNRRG